MENIALILNTFTPAQIVGILASGFIIAGYYCKDDVFAKKLITLGSLAFAIHFYMLDAIIGLAVNIINILRIGLSIKYHGSKKLFWLFVFLYIISGIITFEEWFDILPVIACLVGCYAMYFLSGLRFRQVMLMGTVCWLIYTISLGSIGGIINEVFVFIGHCTTIYRLYKDKQKEDVNHDKA